MSSFFSSFLHVRHQGAIIVIVFLIHITKSNNNIVYQQFLTISETIKVDFENLLSLKTITQKLLTSLIVDALDSYEAYGDE